MPWESWRVLFRVLELMNRNFGNLFNYAKSLAETAGKEIHTAEILAKILTRNDDSGRHGVLVPIEGYLFFPELEVGDDRKNATRSFLSFDPLAGMERKLSYKYYQRYPERRITCLNQLFSDRENGKRLGVFVKAFHKDGTTGYYADVLRERADREFYSACTLFFGSEIEWVEGAFALRTVDAPVFSVDAVLGELLARFDDVKRLGWVDSRRSGDTGVGYTFESLIGVEENNDKRADFKGIEIKCKKTKESGAGGGKINLFQQAPEWKGGLTGIERLKLLGKLEGDGRYSCYSQITRIRNNLDLWLDLQATPQQIDLRKDSVRYGAWLHTTLSRRLFEKHSRAVFIRADSRLFGSKQRFSYKELIYCERPSIERFMRLVEERKIVFEFLMRENSRGGVRNHGYPWRLCREGDLSELFSLKVRLR